MIYTISYQKALYLLANIINEKLVDCINYGPNKDYIYLDNNSEIFAFYQLDNNYQKLMGRNIDYVLIDCIPDNLFMLEIYHYLNRYNHG